MFHVFVEICHRTEKLNLTAHVVEWFLKLINVVSV
jgi:hypothetical protein